MKKLYSNYQIMMFIEVICVVLYAALTVCFFNANLLNFLIFVSIAILTPIIFYTIIYHISKKLPAACKFNVYGCIELHIENTNDGDINKFIRLCLECILIAKQKKKNILIDTCMTTPSFMKGIFRESVSYSKIWFIQRFFTKICYLLYNKKQKSKYKPNRKSWRYILDPTKISDKQITSIKRRFKYNLT